MTRVLVGSTGFVGSTLLGATQFDVAVHRPDVERLRGLRAELVVCAGLPAAKWASNRNPDADSANVDALCAVLRDLRADRFVLISTVDTYPSPEGVDERTDVDGATNHAYGANRRRFEQFVQEHFTEVSILRLPALFGTGLRKNVLFDLLRGNLLAKIQPRSRFQWYPLRRLWSDIERALTARVSLANLVTEPLETAALLQSYFPGLEVGSEADAPVRYDVRTQHAATFGGSGHYLLGATAVLEEIGRFVDEERRR